ncbi:hypothetical protein D3C84_807390 [compost metagenome]
MGVAAVAVVVVVAAVAVALLLRLLDVDLVEDDAGDGGVVLQQLTDAFLRQRDRRGFGLDHVEQRVGMGGQHGGVADRLGRRGVDDHAVVLAAQELDDLLEAR